MAHNPIILRTENNLDNYVFHKKTVSNKYFSYLLNEQQKVIKFLFSFFKQSGLKVHSFNIICDQKGNYTVSIKYFFTKPFIKTVVKRLRVFFFEEALIKSINNISNKPFLLIFFNLTKKSKKVKSFIKAVKHFSTQEILSCLSIFGSIKGNSYFLTELLTKKLENLRSKIDQKSQGRLLVFLEKFIYHIKEQNPFGVLGIKMQLKGRINGVARSKKWSVSKGLIQLQQLSVKIDFSAKQVQTVFGTFGIKLWIIYS